jgi:spore coat polysaccharide biosynthesis protein SpsF (cytidylyltransferase family)
LLALIQARSNSKRFKNKVFFKIFNKTLIEHVINNVRNSKLVKKIVVTTSKEKSDQKLVKLLKSKNINVFRGSLNNVAKRVLDAAKEYKSKYFLRVNGDSPMIDCTLIDKAIRIHKKNKSFDLITNVFPRTFPPGQSVEIIRVKILDMNIKLMTNEDKEHITKYFYRNSSNFKIKNFKCNQNYKYKNLKKMTIDYKCDLPKIKKIINDN